MTSEEAFPDALSPWRGRRAGRDLLRGRSFPMFVRSRIVVNSHSQCVLAMLNKNALMSTGILKIDVLQLPQSPPYSSLHRDLPSAPS